MTSNESDIRNAALEEGWKEPPLTCPHIDRAIESGTLPPAVVEELVAIRDINSQLRYGTWYLKARVDELEAEVTTYQGLLDAAIDDYNDARNSSLEEAASMAEKMPKLRQISTEHVKSTGPADFAAAIRALKSDPAPVPAPKPFTFADPAAQLQHERHRAESRREE